MLDMVLLTPFLKLCDNNDARHASVKFENKITLHNFYVPAGGDVPDTKTNPKFKYKLDGNS